MKVSSKSLLNLTSYKATDGMRVGKHVFGIKLPIEVEEAYLAMSADKRIKTMRKALINAIEEETTACSNN